MFCKKLMVNGLSRKRPVSDGAELYKWRGRMRMASLNVDARSSAHCRELPSSYWEPLWYAAYTSSNHEKRVVELLSQRSVEHFLPLYQTARRWKDRLAQLQLPLFPGYVFVRLALHDRLQVLQVPGVSKLVGFNGTPTALPQAEIDALRASLLNGVRAEPHPYLTVGRKVRVRGGSLAGLEGILVRKKNRTRFVISLDLIMRSVAVEVDALELERL
jgi:transcription antitermination factor NusG